MPEDRATQACDPSAGTVPYGTGGFPLESRLLSCHAGGSKAINARWNSVQASNFIG